jgi:hypothetical protein
MANQSRKYADLNEYCSTVLNTKLPKVYTKDQLNERVKKNGGWSTYFYWIVNEMNLISNLITTVKNHLQVTLGFLPKINKFKLFFNFNLKLIKSATDSKKLGWDCPNEIIEVADSLYHQQIPKSWCLMFGGNYYFPHYPLGSFINDLSMRFTHIEKCLTMVNLFLFNLA